jgi:uncharacterized protein YciI
MFIVLLKFSDNKNQASEFMLAHKAWIKQGFEQGIFLVVGSLQPNKGGAIMAHNTSLLELQQRVSEDPFVAENIVTAQIMEISANQADQRLNFLLA